MNRTSSRVKRDLPQAFCEMAFFADVAAILLPSVGEPLAEGAPWRMGSRGRVQDPPLREAPGGSQLACHPAHSWYAISTPRLSSSLRKGPGSSISRSAA